MDAIQILTVQLQKHPKVCVIYCISENPRVCVLNIQSDCPSVALEKSCRFSVFLLCVFRSGLQSRAALSLLGYCYYHIQDFGASAECYEQLTQLHPEVEDYKVYYAQSLYKAGAYAEATRASFALDNTSSHTKVPRHVSARRTLG